MQGRLQLAVFRPERVIHEGPRRAHHHRGVTLALIAIRFEPVSPAKGRKEASLPLIRHGELRLGQGFGFDRGAERLPEPLHRSRRSLSFTRGRGALEQGGNLAQLFAELLFGCHSSTIVRCETARQAQRFFWPITGPAATPKPGSLEHSRKGY